jgi:hypothetical protein
MLNKYIYAECPQDYWPQIKTISAKSYNDAVEKLQEQYGNELEDDKISYGFSSWDKFREYLNENYTIALSDLEIYEEI